MAGAFEKLKSLAYRAEGLLVAIDSKEVTNFVFYILFKKVEKCLWNISFFCVESLKLERRL